MNWFITFASINVNHFNVYEYTGLVHTYKLKWILVLISAAFLAQYKYSRDPDITPTPGPCCLVIDSGYSFTHLVPYYNGQPLKHAIRRYDILYDSLAFGVCCILNLLFFKFYVSYLEWGLQVASWIGIVGNNLRYHSLICCDKWLFIIWLWIPFLF